MSPAPDAQPPVVGRPGPRLRRHQDRPDRRRRTPRHPPARPDRRHRPRPRADPQDRPHPPRRLRTARRGVIDHRIPAPTAWPSPRTSPAGTRSRWSANSPASSPVDDPHRHRREGRGRVTRTRPAPSRAATLGLYVNLGTGLAVAVVAHGTVLTGRHGAPARSATTCARARRRGPHRPRPLEAAVSGIGPAPGAPTGVHAGTRLPPGQPHHRRRSRADRRRRRHGPRLARAARPAARRPRRRRALSAPARTRRATVRRAPARALALAVEAARPGPKKTR